MKIKITFTFKDGTVKQFNPEQRPGGSYTNTLRYEPGFVVVKNVWDKEISFRTDDVAQIETEPDRY